MTTSKTQNIESVDGSEWAEIAVGSYKGTLTDPLSRRYSPWAGNVAMHHGTDTEGREVTVYYKTVDSRVLPRFSRD